MTDLATLLKPLGNKVRIGDDIWQGLDVEAGLYEDYHFAEGHLEVLFVPVMHNIIDVEVYIDGQAADGAAITYDVDIIEFMAELELI